MKDINYKLKFVTVRHSEWESKIPYYLIKGHKPGKTMFISGGLHGSEINGISTVRQFLEQASKDALENRLYGTLYVLPVLNISGFEKMLRRTQEDQKDPNRAFGRGEPKSFAEALANTLTDQIFKKCDFGIDFHDAGGNSVLMPHVRVHKVDPDRVNLLLGESFGTKILVQRKANRHTLAEHLRLKHGVSVVTVEVGGAQTIDQPGINTCLRGIKNLLIHTGMLKEGVIKVPKKQFLLSTRIGIKTLDAGEIHLHCELGDLVKVGDEVGWIYYPRRQKKEILRAPTTGFIFAKCLRNQIPKDGVMFGVMEEEDTAEAVKRRVIETLERVPEFMIKHYDFSK